VLYYDDEELTEGLKRVSDLTPKQQLFAQLFVQTGNASEAYRRVYDCRAMKTRTIEKRSSELRRHGAVAGRIAALRAEHAERHKSTVDDLVAELEAARKLAMAKGAPVAAVSAILAKAKLLGLVVDKSESTASAAEPVKTEMSDLEMARRVAFALDRAGRQLEARGQGSAA
jgi:phage terminase small subunit